MNWANRCVHPMYIMNTASPFSEAIILRKVSTYILFIKKYFIDGKRSKKGESFRLFMRGPSTTFPEIILPLCN